MSRRAFTLIELVVATALFGYFTLLLMQMNSQTAMVFARLKGSTVVVSQSKVLYHYLGKDLAIATNCLWSEIDERLSLTTEKGTVQYSLDDGRLMRSFSGGQPIAVATKVRQWGGRLSTSTNGLELTITFTAFAGPERRVRLYRSFAQGEATGDEFAELAELSRDELVELQAQLIEEIAKLEQARDDELKDEEKRLEKLEQDFTRKEASLEKDIEKFESKLDKAIKKGKQKDIAKYQRELDTAKADLVDMRNVYKAERSASEEKMDEIKEDSNEAIAEKEEKLALVERKLATMPEDTEPSANDWLADWRASLADAIAKWKSSGRWK